MSTRHKHWLWHGVVLAVLWGGMACAWAQVEKIASRIEALEPTQQRQLQALMASRQERDGARLFTDEEIRAAMGGNAIRVLRAGIVPLGAAE